MKYFQNETFAESVVEVSALVMARVRAELRRRASDRLSFTQTRTLGFLNKTPGSSVSDVAEVLGVGIPTASKVVDELVQRDLLRRVTCEMDRRRVELSVTDEGDAAFREAVQPALDAVGEQLAPLGEEDEKRIREALALLLPLLESRERDDDEQ